MFGKKNRNSTVVRTLVGGDTRVHGDIEFTGGFHVDGYVKGNVEAADDEPATLSISEGGCVEGSVVVPNLTLNGTVKGDTLEATYIWSKKGWYWKDVPVKKWFKGSLNR